jgi:hypothetical protein
MHPSTPPHRTTYTVVSIIPKIFLGAMLFSTFRHALRFYCEELLATRLIPILEDHLLSAAGDC